MGVGRKTRPEPPPPRQEKIMRQRTRTENHPVADLRKGDYIVPEPWDDLVEIIDVSTGDTNVMFTVVDTDNHAETLTLPIDGTVKKMWR
jgi:hypothetical protein